MERIAPTNKIVWNEWSGALAIGEHFRERQYATGRPLFVGLLRCELLCMARVWHIVSSDFVTSAPRGPHRVSGNHNAPDGF